MLAGYTAWSLGTDLVLARWKERSQLSQPVADTGVRRVRVRSGSQPSPTISSLHALK